MVRGLSPWTLISQRYGGRRQVHDKSIKLAPCGDNVDPSRSHARGVRAVAGSPDARNTADSRRQAKPLRARAAHSRRQAGSLRHVGLVSVWQALWGALLGPDDFARVYESREHSQGRTAFTALGGATGEGAKGERNEGRSKCPLYAPRRAANLDGRLLQEDHSNSGSVDNSD